MYVPPAFRQDAPADLHATIRAYPFATLVSVVDGAPSATHVPLLLDAERGPHGTLVGHVARANPHAGLFDGRSRALAIFHGPHAYVSPRWYAGGPNVPTWNYVVVHASGVLRPIEEPERVRGLLARTAAVFEAGAEAPWSPEREPVEYVERLARAIVAFELPIDELVGKRKLSQNKRASDRTGVVAGLTALDEPDGVAIAQLMAALDVPSGAAEPAA